jgi:hypothetical protein
MAEQMIENEIVITLENIEQEKDLEPREGFTNINSPSQDERCVCCKRHPDELEPFGKAGDPLIGDFDGIFLISKTRPLCPPIKEFDMLWAEHWRHEDTVGYEKATERMIQKFGKKKVDELIGYIEIRSFSPEYTIECRDCASLDDYEFYEKMEKGLHTDSTPSFESKTTAKDNDRVISWPEFKQKYLPEVEKLAEILGLRREDIIKNYKHPVVKNDSWIPDEDWKFVNTMMHVIRECRTREDKQDFLRRLREHEGAKNMFEDLSRIWLFGWTLYGESYFNLTAGYGGRRSELGKGDVVDILLLSETGGYTYIDFTVGEDYADTSYPVVVKIKRNSDMTDEEIVRALRDAADSYEASEAITYRPFATYRVPKDKEIQAILVGIRKNNPELREGILRGDISPTVAMKKAGWIDPNVSLDTGLGEMLQMGWPHLHERVLSGKMSPFDALLETRLVNSKNVYEVEIEQIGKTDKQLLQELEDL